jgi:hypothetical protein
MLFENDLLGSEIIKLVGTGPQGYSAEVIQRFLYILQNSYFVDNSGITHLVKDYLRDNGLSHLLNSPARQVASTYSYLFSAYPVYLQMDYSQLASVIQMQMGNLFISNSSLVSFSTASCTLTKIDWATILLQEKVAVSSIDLGFSQLNDELVSSSDILSFTNPVELAEAYRGISSVVALPQLPNLNLDVFGLTETRPSLNLGTGLMTSRIDANSVPLHGIDMTSWLNFLGRLVRIRF